VAAVGSSKRVSLRREENSYVEFVGKYSQSKYSEPTESKEKIIGRRYCNCNCFIQDFLDDCRDKTAGKQPRFH